MLTMLHVAPRCKCAGLLRRAVAPGCCAAARWEPVRERAARRCGGRMVVGDDGSEAGSGRSLAAATACGARGAVAGASGRRALRRRSNEPHVATEDAAALWPLARRAPARAIPSVQPPGCTPTACLEFRIGVYAKPTKSHPFRPGGRPALLARPVRHGFPKSAHSRLRRSAQRNAADCSRVGAGPARRVLAGELPWW